MEESKFISSIQKSVKFRDFDEEYLLSLSLPCGTKSLRVLELVDSFNYAFEKGEMPRFQKRGIITLIPKEDKDRSLLDH